ncbi:MAG: 4Fe-4S dicluster domain-containing protein [Candidatus Zhuqueibacterota bacterium]
MVNVTVSINDLKFPNPIWTAAGPAAADAAMLARAVKGGAGGLVTKTISATPARVPVPNIHQPFHGSLLNAELWSERHYSDFIENELPKIKALGLPVIVSVGYSPEELGTVGRALAHSGLMDAVEFSIHYVDKDIDNLKRMAAALRDAVPVPVLAKLSPSIQDLAGLVRGLDSLVDGYVAINSLGPALDFDIATLQPYLGSADGRGWLSGRCILPVGLHFVATLAQLTDKPIVGVGGIQHVHDVIKYILAGASAVQVCSLVITQGQQVYGELAVKLAHWMTENGYASVEEMRGAFLRREKHEPSFLGLSPTLAPVLDRSRCNVCMICAKSCLHQAIHVDEKEFVVAVEKCVSCGVCVSVCLRQALRLTPVPDAH